MELKPVEQIAKDRHIPQVEIEPNRYPYHRKDFKKVLEDAEKKLEKKAQLEDETLGIKHQKPSNVVEAEESMKLAEQRDMNTEIKRIVAKYNVIIKLAHKDAKRWAEYAKTKSPELFIENVNQYTGDDWDSINTELEKVIKQLDSIVVG